MAVEAFSVIELIGSSPATEHARHLVATAARSHAPVLLHGEPGLDTLAVARAVRDSSPHWLGPFVAVDCESYAPDELETEIARAVDAGPGGTLVLANIDELPSTLQSRLSLMLRDRVDAFVIATFTGSVEEAVHDGKLRGELCGRFSSQIELPPLRRRTADIPLLAGCIAADTAGACARSVPTFDGAALAVLAALPWRRNITELREVVELLVTTATDSSITLEQVLAQVPIERLSSRRPATGTLRTARQHFEREYISSVLLRHRWRMDDAARTLGIQRTNLYRKVRQLGIGRAKGTK